MWLEYASSCQGDVGSAYYRSVIHCTVAANADLNSKAKCCQIIENALQIQCLFYFSPWLVLAGMARCLLCGVDRNKSALTA